MARRAAETSFAGLLAYLESLPDNIQDPTPSIHQNTTDVLQYPSIPFKKNPHKKPHPKYEKGKTILGKTKFGILVTKEQFVRFLPSLKHQYLTKC
jgi:hypothetical protein